MAAPSSDPKPTCRRARRLAAPPRRLLHQIRQPFGRVGLRDGSSGGGHAAEAGRVLQEGVHRAGQAVDRQLLLQADGGGAGILQQAGVVALVVVGGDLQRPVLGINIAADYVAAGKSVHGALVLTVMPGGPAARAGIVGVTYSPDGRAMLGDVIVKIDTFEIKKGDDVYRALENKNVGDTVTLEVANAGRLRTVKVQLEAAP